MSIPMRPLLRPVVLLGGPWSGNTIACITPPDQCLMIQYEGQVEWYYVMDGDAARWVPPAERARIINMLRLRRENPGASS